MPGWRPLQSNLIRYYKLHTVSTTVTQGGFKVCGKLHTVSTTVAQGGFKVCSKLHSQQMVATSVHRVRATKHSQQTMAQGVFKVCMRLHTVSTTVAQGGFKVCGKLHSRKTVATAVHRMTVCV
jgi:hypothetical protein